MGMWQTIAVLLGALGGWDAIKYFLNRRNNHRMTEAQADKDEFHVLRETIEFLQDQLKQKEERFAEQTNRLRTSKEREFELLAENGNLKLELATKRCEVKRCANRQPQNGY